MGYFCGINDTFRFHKPGPAAAAACYLQPSETSRGNQSGDMQEQTVIQRVIPLIFGSHPTHRRLSSLIGPYVNWYSNQDFCNSLHHRFNHAFHLLPIPTRHRFDMRVPHECRSFNQWTAVHHWKPVSQ